MKDIWFKVRKFGNTYYINGRTGSIFSVELYESNVFVRCNGYKIKEILVEDEQNCLKTTGVAESIVETYILGLNGIVEKT